MRSRITRRLVIAVLAVPAIDAHARQLPVLSLLSAGHTTDTGLTPQDATLLVGR
jgi:hypothetical protein